MKSMKNFEVKNVRLKIGEDIICFYYEENGISYLKYPKTFYTTYDSEIDSDDYRREIALLDWIPKEAYFKQEIEFKSENVLFTGYPTISFGYEYLNSIIKYVETSDSEFAKKIKEVKFQLEKSSNDSETIH